MTCRVDQILHYQRTNTILRMHIPAHERRQLRAHLSPAQADAALRMAEMGWLFRRVQAFAERGTSITTSAGTGAKKAAGGLPPPPQLGGGGRSRVGAGVGGSSSGRGGGGAYGSQYQQQQQQAPLGLVGQALCFVLQV